MPAGMDYGRRSANKRKEVYTMDVRKMRNAALGKRVVAALESRQKRKHGKRHLSLFQREAP